MDAAGRGQQPPFNYQPEGPYRRQLCFGSLIATVLLVATHRTCLAVGLIGFCAGCERS